MLDLRTLVLAMVAGSALGCAGKAPESTDDSAADDDALAPDATDVDAPPAITGQALSGVAKDYSGGDPLTDTTVATQGIDPAMTATSSATGEYALANIPTGSKVFLDVTRANYRVTHNPAATVADADVVQDVYAVSQVYANSQYTRLGDTVTPNTAIVFVELLRNNGTPLVGVPLTGITFVSATGDTPITGVLGPYVLDALGQVDATLTVTTLNNATSRIAFLDVPPGTAAVKLTYDGGNGTPMTVRAPITTIGNGATIAKAGGMMGSGGDITNPSFATDIYPRLQKAANGGLGCANCHTAGGPAAILPYDKPAADTLAGILAATGVIDTTTPANSMILTKPLYEQTGPQNHPNATFLTVDDADYKLFLKWITNGTKP